MAYIVVTGASSGIGAAICYELARQNFDLIMVARQLKLLQELKQSLVEMYSIKVVIMSYDLSLTGNPEALHRACQDYEVIGLVNNAGYGLYGLFSEIELEAELNLIDLNVTNTHLLSKLFLNDFIKQGKGYLLNVASMAAFQAGPLMASYYASKAYILNLTEAIAEELKESHPQIVVSVLCPGPVATNFQKRAAIKTVNNRIPSAEEVAIYAVNKWFKGNILIIPKFSNRVLVFANRFIPRRFGRYLVKKNQLKKKS